jgi:superfamily II DNA or RNA helicase
MSRDERQELSIKKWKDNNGKGTVIASTGFGKTRVALKVIESINYRNINTKIIVVVPTTYLKDQWELALETWKLIAEVYVINTAIKSSLSCDVLILDEIHRYAADTFKLIFDIKYQFILGLTATYERSDGKHELIEKYCPVIDEVTLEEATTNEWLSKFKAYDIIIPVDLKSYDKINRSYPKFFAMFGHDFELAMKVSQNDDACKKYAAHMGWSYKDTKVAAINFIKSLSKRKQWIHGHPIKVEVAKQILDKRLDKRCITFSMYNKQADEISKTHGVSYHSGLTKKQLKANMDNFLSLPYGVINTGNKMDEGADIPMLEVGIILAGQSSSRQYIQRRGRVIRKEGDKESEIFNLILDKTQDISWQIKRKTEAELIPYKYLNDIL